MALRASQGVMPNIQMAPSPFIQRFDTSVVGDQPQDATGYSLHPVVTAELSKIEQIVEYLKVLYR